MRCFDSSAKTRPVIKRLKKNVENFSFIARASSKNPMKTAAPGRATAARAV
jgi:hypothetical protein